MKTKIVTIEIGGEEVVRYLGTLTIEVPISVDQARLEELSPGFFDDLCDKVSWEVEDSDGLYPCDNTEVVVLPENDSSSSPAAQLALVENQLVIQPVSAFVANNGTK